MLKGKKIIFVIVEMIIICLALGSLSSYATEVKTITANTSKNTNTANTSTTTDDEEDEENTNKNSNKNTNKAINTNSNKNTNKVNSISSSNYSNTNKNVSNSSELPYAGEGNTSIVFVGIALVASAAYAYKKISEYKNI